MTASLTRAQYRAYAGLEPFLKLICYRVLLMRYRVIIGLAGLHIGFLFSSGLHH